MGRESGRRRNRREVEVRRVALWSRSLVGGVFSTRAMRSVLLADSPPLVLVQTQERRGRQPPRDDR